MVPEKPYRQHLNGSADLITTYEAVRAGFIALALEKNRRATPYVEQARALKAAASQAATPMELVHIDGIQLALLAAAGVSDKAAGHLQPQDKGAAIQGLIKNFLDPAGSDFVEELVFRFLLTRGDTLGGSIRNIGGTLAQRKLSRSLISTLTLAGRFYSWLDARSRTWVHMQEDDTDIELYLRGLSWQQDEQRRTLMYNLTIPLVKNNVDICLLSCTPQALPSAIGTPTAYVALGELKGGIDPAGADEHWKTARTALDRIRHAFSSVELSPHTFFIGAAIERKMATEIWGQLEHGALQNAANLTHTAQISSISRWLCNL